jgi:hypothetical protein
MNVKCKDDSVFLAFNIIDKMKKDDGHALHIHFLIHYYNTSKVFEQSTKIKKM